MNIQRIDLYFMDEDFGIIGIATDFESLQWVDKYFASGEFEIHLGFKYAPIMRTAKYVYRSDKLSTGMIVGFYASPLSRKCHIKGKFLEEILHTRVLDDVITLRGNTEDVCIQLVEQFCMTGSRAIPNLELGVYGGGMGTLVDIQRSGKTVYDVISEILIVQDMWFRVRYDRITNKMYFEIYKGLDRTQTQTVNDWCIFSSEFYNLLEETYERIFDERNYVYVAGQGAGVDAGGERIIVVIDQTAGKPRKELWVDARDLQQEEGMTDAEYRELLFNRGYQKLAEYSIIENVSFKANPLNAMVYAVGDECTYSNNELGILASGRITEEWEVVQPSEISKSIVLGKEGMTISQKIRRGGI